jgi:radical SAM superfamily enzyme YgiQ (UPF0313 family)
MKVLLINPPSPFKGKSSIPTIPPLGIAYVGAVLEKSGVDVKIVDLDIEREKMEMITDTFASFKPEYVGISGVTPQMNNVYKIAELAEKTINDAIVVIGGPHPSALPERSLIESKGSVDIVVMGEGEYTFLDIVKGNDWKKIKGIVYSEDGTAIRNEGREPIKDLDSLPFPARHLLNIQNYAGWYPTKARPSTHIIASRGCPFNCIYCSEKAVFGRIHRRRSPKNVVDEIERLVAEYGMEEVAFYDDLFTVNKKWVMEICDGILSRGIKIHWKALSHPNTVDYELLKKMKEAGCWIVSYGFESGSPEILKNIRKNTTPEHGINAAKLTKKAGMKMYGFFMIGNIGETKHTLHQTIDFAKKIKPDYYQITIIRPDPGSDQYELYKDEIEKKQVSWEDYYAFPKDISKIPVVGTELGIEDLIKYRDFAFLSISKKKLMADMLRSGLRLDLRRFRRVHLPVIKSLITGHSMLEYNN